MDNSVDPPVRGFLHTPEDTNHNALILAHGAGSDAQAPLLIALAETFAAAGFTVLRCDLPYRQTRAYGPPGPGDAARDRAGLKNAIAAMKKILGEEIRRGDSPPKQSQAKIFLGGHSYGCRQSSMLCAEFSKEEPDLSAGLLLLSYPLHPPRKPEQLRTQHLTDLRTPTLFVHGTRDPFGSVQEMEQAIKLIPAKTKLLTVEGAGHDLGFKGKAKNQEFPQAVLAAFITFATHRELSS